MKGMTYFPRILISDYLRSLFDHIYCYCTLLRMCGPKSSDRGTGDEKCSNITVLKERSHMRSPELIERCGAIGKEIDTFSFCYNPHTRKGKALITLTSEGTCIHPVFAIRLSGSAVVFGRQAISEPMSTKG
eukprot:Nk52_evm26s1763 gene=Nk52_evmTU26s1763